MTKKDKEITTPLDVFNYFMNLPFNHPECFQKSQCEIKREKEIAEELKSDLAKPPKNWLDWIASKMRKPKK